MKNTTVEVEVCRNNIKADVYKNINILPVNTMNNMKLYFLNNVAVFVIANIKKNRSVCPNCLKLVGPCKPISFA